MSRIAHSIIIKSDGKQKHRRRNRRLVKRNHETMIINVISKFIYNEFIKPIINKNNAESSKELSIKIPTDLC